jgi:hypothetical protein
MDDVRENLQCDVQKWQHFLNRINHAKSVLAIHTGWARLLHDITFVVTSILTFGLVNVVSKVTTGQYRFFQMPKPPILTLLEKIEETVTKPLTPKRQSSLTLSKFKTCQACPYL